METTIKGLGFKFAKEVFSGELPGAHTYMRPMKSLYWENRYIYIYIHICIYRKP